MSLGTCKSVSLSFVHSHAETSWRVLIRFIKECPEVTVHIHCNYVTFRHCVSIIFMQQTNLCQVWRCM